MNPSPQTKLRGDAPAYYSREVNAKVTLDAFMTINAIFSNTTSDHYAEVFTARRK